MIKPEENVYSDVYRILMAGMLVSTALYAIGLVLALLHPGFVPLDAGWVLAHYRFSAVARGLAAADPAAYMLTATLLLILTPVARVVVSIHAFWADGDYRYAAITGVVLLIMAATVVLSRLGLR